MQRFHCVSFADLKSRLCLEHNSYKICTPFSLALTSLVASQATGHRQISLQRNVPFSVSTQDAVQTLFSVVLADETFTAALNDSSSVLYMTMGENIISAVSVSQGKPPQSWAGALPLCFAKVTRLRKQICIKPTKIQQRIFLSPPDQTTN